MRLTLVLGALGLASQALAAPSPNPDAIPEPFAEPESLPQRSQLGTRYEEGPLIPGNTYLKQTPEYILKELVGNIVCGQSQIKEISPHCSRAFDKSIEVWKKLEKQVKQWHKLTESNYVEAIAVLREALYHLKHHDIDRNPKLRKLVYNLLINNLFLIGFLNEAHGASDIPSYLIDRPGDLAGALIHFVGIDVTKSLEVR
ncbi:hypothetical protein HJFPF1_04766 [Paramyrothecium foliicola]|nr:hypothetical protein HJFPF1_04766 [Paramyrothecium foliicola]